MSSSSSSSSSDPNGWIKNPPTQIVKIYGITTRTTLNEQLGLVLQYNTERSRYIVHLCNIGQEQIALKADNLTAASYMDTIRGQYQLLSNDPRIRRQIVSVTQQIQQRTGISSPIYIGIGILVFLFVLFYFIGFSKTIMLLSFILFIGMIIGPDLFSASSSSSSSSLLSTIIRNFPYRLETVIRDHFPFGSYIASNKYATMAVFGLMVVLLLQVLITPNRPNNTRNNNKNPSSSSRAPMYPTADLSPVVVVTSDGSSSSTTAAAPAATSPSSLLSYEQKEYYYKLGFDDATTQFDFGTSLPPKPTPPPLLDDEDDEEDATRTTTSSRYLNTNTDDDDEFADDSEFATTTTTTPPRKTTTPRGTGRNANDGESGSGGGGGGGSGNTGSNNSSSNSSSSLYQNISTATSFFVIYKTLSDLARDPTTQRYNINLIQQNIANLDTWRMGVLGFAIYRLVNQFLF